MMLFLKESRPRPLMLGFRGVSQLASSVSDATAKSLEDVEGKANSIARFLADTTKGTVLQLNNNILFITKQFKDDFEKWNTLEEKIRGYEKKLNYGYLFFGLEEYPERVTELPLPVMAKLANWIHLYALVKLFDARTNPT